MDCAAAGRTQVAQILESMNAAGLERGRWKFTSKKHAKWVAHAARAAEDIVVIERGPENPRQLAEAATGGECVLIYAAGGAAVIHLSAGRHGVTVPVRTALELDAVCGALAGCGFGDSPDAVRKAMDAVPLPRLGFSNDRVLPTTYMLNHILTQTGRTEPADTPWRTLHRLGWGVDAERRGDGTVRQGTPTGDVCVMVRGGNGALPEFEAHSALQGSRWVILVQGARWSLYRRGAPPLCSFAIDVDDPIGRAYLGAVFGAASYDGLLGRVVDEADEETMQAWLIRRITRDGAFEKLASGLLTEAARGTAGLKSIRDETVAILFRVWFISHAEGRGILPVENPQYGRISLRSMYDRIQRYESDPDATDCWTDMTRLFDVVREGSSSLGIPKYAATLFGDDIPGPVKNRHLTEVLRIFSPRYGMYGDADHLMGGIYETLTGVFLERTPHGGIAATAKNRTPLRKSLAAYYTPRALVKYLAQSGLEPVLERRRAAAEDRIPYMNPPETADACMDGLLDLRILDPTAGSGRFLTEALDIVTGWAAELLAERADRAALDVLFAGARPPAGYGSLLKRIIVERCIFGVDLDPMAAELARISLWLATGSAEPPSGTHIRVGDVTLGMWLADLHDRASSLDHYSSTPPASTMTLGEQREALDMLAVSIMEDGSRSVLRPNAPHRTVASRRRVEQAARRYGLYHWEAEMPEAFCSRRGFDVILGNPPWDQVRVEPVEVYKTHSEGLDHLGRRKNQDTLREMAGKEASQKRLAEYRDMLTKRRRLYHTQYKTGKGGVDTYWLVLNKVFSILAEGGTVSMVVPAHLLHSTKNTSLRRALLDMHIRCLYVFQNSLSIFPIDRRFRFLLFSAQKSPGPDVFPAGFYLSRPESLRDNTLEPERFTTMSKHFIREISPAGLKVPELGRNTLWDIHAKIHRSGTRLEEGRDGWTITKYTHMTRPASIHRPPPYPPGYAPALSGKNIHHYNHRYSPVGKAADLRAYRIPPIRDGYILVGRAVTGATNTRTVITTVMPPGYLADTSLFALGIRDGEGGRSMRDYLHQMLYLEGIFNSLPFDFVARTLVNNHLEGVILSLPVPRPSKLDAAVSDRAARLTVDGSEEFDGLADCMGIQNRHASGEERVRLAAEIDAMAAYQYGLDADEYDRLATSFKLGRGSMSSSPDPKLTYLMKDFGGAVRDLAAKYIRDGREF